MNAPVSMTDIALSLSAMSRALATAQYELDELEAKYVKAKEEHTMAYAVEYLKSGEDNENGRPASVETRKARTTIATHSERLAMESVGARLTNKKGEISSIKVRIDCARSSGTLLRAEIEIDRVR